MAGYFRLSEAIYNPEISQTAIFVIIFLTYLFSIGYVVLAKLVDSQGINIYIQSICDVLIITVLVYYTGGIRSVYPVFFQSVIIYSVLFLGRRGGIFIASICAILYGILINLQYYRFIYPVFGGMGYDVNYPAGYFFFRTLIYILSFYVVALLASFVVERERRARALLEEKENAFDQLDLLHRSIIESVDTGILTMNLQKNIKSFNRAAEVITGYSLSEIINRNIEEILPDYSRLHTTVDETNETNIKSMTKRSELMIKSKGGGKLAVGCSISSLMDHRGKHIGEILIFQDLSDIKAMENAVEKNRRLAFVGEMAAGLAHEMRNPMASISGSIQLLKRDLMLSEADERLMQIILRGKDQLENFIKDFLLMARPAAGVRDVCHINSIVEDVIEAVHYIPEWDDRYVIKMDMPVDIRIHANKTEIRQVVWNLVINAVQAMPDGGKIDISAGIIKSDGSDDKMEIRIRDNGTGISDEDRLMVFEPFYTTKERGTGLGLAIVTRIVERYKGNIAIESNNGNGTLFIVSLPLNTTELEEQFK